jgi:hypothetical protein
LIELNRGLARRDLPDFELARRNDVDALGAFLEANGMTWSIRPANITAAPIISPTPTA